MIEKLFLPHLMLKGALDHVVDNHLRDTVAEPAKGSIVYCDLLAGTSEHSGVYLGGGAIMHLNNRGVIERVSPKEFVSDTTALSIYVGCRAGEPVGNPEVAERAELYRKSLIARDYNVILNNCHQFTAACLNGDPENAHNFLWMLKDECKKKLSVDTWRVWERPWLISNRETEAKDLSADELEHLISSKIKLSRELNDLSASLAAKVYELIDQCPFSGPFLEKRTAAWEKKNALLEKQLDGVSLAIEEVEKEIDLLEQQRPL